MATRNQNRRQAALIIADDSVAAPLVLGKSLTELQIARVVSAGARHVVCLVRQVTSQILSAADNLRANGLSIDIVRNVAEAGDAIHPDEAVFLVASGVLASVETLDDLTKSGAPSLLCLETGAADAQFEIVDSEMRWSGYALLDGATLRRISAMVGDWDAASTILRQMVQDGAKRVILTSGQLADAMIIVRTEAEAIDAGRRLLNESVEQSAGIGMRWVGQPVSRILARLAGELGLKARVAEWSAAGLAVLASVIGLTGWLTVALLLLVFAFLAHAAALRLGSALGEFNRYAAAQEIAVKAAAALTTCAVAITLATRTGQWGCLLLGGLLLGSHLLIDRGSKSLSGRTGWSADPLSGIVMMFAGFIVTFPVTGLVLATGHAMASFLVREHASRDADINQA